MSSKIFPNLNISNGVFVVAMPDDGNCLFHSIADQFGYMRVSESIDFSELRQAAVDYISNNIDYFMPFKEDEDETMSDYIIRMKYTYVIIHFFIV